MGGPLFFLKKINVFILLFEEFAGTFCSILLGRALLLGIGGTMVEGEPRIGLRGKMRAAGLIAACPRQRCQEQQNHGRRCNHGFLGSHSDCQKISAPDPAQGSTDLMIIRAKQTTPLPVFLAEGGGDFEEKTNYCRLTLGCVRLPPSQPAGQLSSGAEVGHPGRCWEVNGRRIRYDRETKETAARIKFLREENLLSTKTLYFPA